MSCKMYFLYFAVTALGNAKDALMFSKYNYSLKDNLVADCCPELEIFGMPH